MIQFKQAKELVELLKKASDSYYNQSESIISDSEFDQKKDLLISLYEKVLIPKKSFDLNLVKEVEAFLVQIGAPVSTSEWSKAKHKTPMASLEKVNSKEDFLKWTQEINDDNYIVMEKLDGISIDLEYDNGKLIKAITRGDGEIGEEITQNVVKMKNIKTFIPEFTGNLRGEILLSYKGLEQINYILIKENKPELKNPRNAASGISKRLDGKFCDFLFVVCYDCLGLKFQTFEEKMKFIENLGVVLSFWKKGHKNDIIEIFNNYEKEKRISLEYLIDGLVISNNDLTKDFGFVNSNPKSKIAWKFKPISIKTEIINIVWDIGSSRRITPVAVVKPVKICGVTIQNVSLYNYENFKKLKLYKNCEVVVTRANDVIPVLTKL